MKDKHIIKRLKFNKISVSELDTKKLYEVQAGTGISNINLPDFANLSKNTICKSDA